MGTSKSSGGSPGGVPLVPPWTPAPPLPAATPPEEPQSQPNQFPSTPQVMPSSLIAPRARFVGARRSAGDFATGGNASGLKRSLGHYVRTGLGGKTTGVRRFGGTISTAGALYSALTAAASGQPSPSGSPFDPALLSGKSAHAVTSALLEAVRPADGTLDAEASRDAVCKASADLLTKFDHADIFQLTQEERMFFIESYVARDLCYRFMLDIGKHLQDKAASLGVAQARFKEVLDFVKQAVAAAFRSINQSEVTVQNIRRIVAEAVEDTLSTFEDYL